VEQFLAFAEGQARRRLATTMEQWVAVTDRLLAANDLAVLRGSGATSHESMEALVDRQWPAFVEARRRREHDESWEVEAADITELLQVERSREGGPEPRPAVLERVRRQAEAIRDDPADRAEAARVAQEMEGLY
jgi:hypothetical protein